MARYQINSQSAMIVDAEQWFPDPNISIGYDKYGVEYTITDIRLQTSKGSLNIKPKDWIITYPRGRKDICSPSIFKRIYRLKDK